MPAVRSLFAATEPTHCLRTGERIVATAEWLDYLPERYILQPIVTRKDVRQLMDFIIDAGIWPAATAAFRPERHVRKKRHAH